MKTKFDIAHDLLAVLGTIKDLELEVRKLKKEVEQECWQFRDKQEAENISTLLSGKLSSMLFLSRFLNTEVYIPPYKNRQC